MEKTNKISIRLNGKEQTYEQRSNHNYERFDHTQNEEAAAKEDDRGWGTYDVSGDGDKPRKVVDFEKAREEKNDRSAPFWDDGNRDRSPRLPPFGRKKRRPIRFSLDFFFNSMFLSIIGAIIVGSAFGLLLLNVFTGEETPSATNGNGGTNTVGVGSDDESTVESNTEEVPGFPIPTIELHVVQGGAFSTLEKGNEIVSSFHSKGLPAVLTEHTEPHFLFVGISHSRENADLVADVYEGLQQETFIKAYGVQSHREVPKQWSQFMKLGTEWMKAAADISAKEVAGESSGSTEIEAMLAKGQEWKGSFAHVEPRGEGDHAYELAKEWLEAAEPAFQVFTTSTASSEIAWEAQGKVLEALLNYEKLTASFE
ncbi:MAG: hypothetical protein LRY73_03920 [Bacillus sp. (in: Bacteria)]|nr:hypothetical protein [Bacillus sp. (in: firmicutes)]